MAPRACGGDELRAFRKRLSAAAEKLHPRPAQLRSDGGLQAFLTALYGKAPSRIWQDDVAPFLRSDRLALAILYTEHRALSEADLLDLVEGLLVLERLRNDCARLYDGWPLATSRLDVLAYAWGVTPARAA